MAAASDAIAAAAAGSSSRSSEPVVADGSVASEAAIVANPPTIVPVSTAPTAKNCDTPSACYRSMLDAGKLGDLAAAMNLSQRLDSLPKPSRGDRKAAREANKLGLDALSASRPAEAVRNLLTASIADPADVEAISNLAYAYAAAGDNQRAENAAITALALSSRRTSVWAPLAVTLSKEGRAYDALSAMWLALQFSSDKQKSLSFIDTRIDAESDPATKLMYQQSKAWFVEDKKPSFN
jgi:tetratricopeptide (TPR) repeat protein